MPRGKRCRNFQWRDDDAAYLAERKNDRVVFRKIRREQLKNRMTARIIRGLFLSPLWAPRMTGKSAESWLIVERPVENALKSACSPRPLTPLSNHKI